ncbi:Rv3235 family protein [Nocardioides sp. Soil805]|uniref:Rv3235 family protein n=1 Tax=Nocardioides sp. Soil805 TaxID=1736416 RepID=UPI0007036B83|nr:Rv3235 family protein [Nocardioides sp. Soil805]KRF30231.1 hypothetical protein ASG94_19665 [Nocardioides sp. Soil805]
MSTTRQARPRPGTQAQVIPLRRPVPVASVQGALALDLTPRLDPPEPDTALDAPRLDLVDADGERRHRLDAFVHRYLSAAVEIAMGDRPLSQLLRHTEHGLYQELGRRAATVSAAAGTTPAVGRGRGAVRPTVASVRTSLVAADALEVSARVRHGQRSRALAARFEARDGRWQCVALVFG